MESFKQVAADVLENIVMCQRDSNHFSEGGCEHSMPLEFEEQTLGLLTEYQPYHIKR